VLNRLITRREKPENFKQALERKPDDIKVVIQFSEVLMEAPNSQRFPVAAVLVRAKRHGGAGARRLSLVIGMFGTGSPMTELIPSEGLRQLITGFSFGTTGASIALSVVGKESGAHINPVVTMVFWLFRKLDGRAAVIYVWGS